LKKLKSFNLGDFLNVVGISNLGILIFNNLAISEISSFDNEDFSPINLQKTPVDKYVPFYLLIEKHDNIIFYLMFVLFFGCLRIILFLTFSKSLRIIILTIETSFK
jgi:hypothetical protein